MKRSTCTATVQSHPPGILGDAFRASIALLAVAAGGAVRSPPLDHPGRVALIAPVDFTRLLEELPLMQMKVIRALADRLPDEFYFAG